MSRKFGLVIFFAGLIFCLTAAQSGKSYAAERFLVEAHIEEGGSLLVSEAVTIHFSGGPFSFVFRELPASFTDGVSVLEAGVDGALWPAGTEPGQVEITGRDPVRITWHLPETSDASQTFELKYRLAGVVRQAEAADLLRWWPLPDQYEYLIALSEVKVAYRPSAELLGDPQVSRGSAAVTVEQGLSTFTTGPLEPNSPLEIELRFPAGTLISGPPAWQTVQAQAAERRAGQATIGLLWLIGAAVLFMIGTGIAMLLASGKRRLQSKAAYPAFEPPDDLAPALAGVLRSTSATPSWSHAQGTLFDLAKRGFIAIEELPKEHWYESRDFTIRLLSPPADLRPHEQALLELFYGPKSGQADEVIRLSKLGELITSSRWKIFSHNLEDELDEAGWLDPRRKIARTRLMILAAVFLALGLLIIPLIFLVREITGLWPFSFTFALLGLSLVWFIAASTISVWSAEGLDRADQWEPFYRQIKRVTQSRAAVDRPEDFERFLPYAAAYGLLHPWAKRFEKKGWTATPAYFRSLSTADQDMMAAFVVMTAATSSSGGSAAGATAAGGAAAAGAAGGGASGAG